MGGDDWQKWDDVPLPAVRYSPWGDPYAEIFDWYPWMRSFYTNWEIDYNTRTVGVDLTIALLVVLLEHRTSRVS